MTSLTFYDAVNAQDVPPGAKCVAGYADGAFRSLGPLRERFPAALWLSIATSPSTDAMVLDVESGDATPEEGLKWIRRQITRGVKRPVIYCSLAGVPRLESLLHTSGLTRSDIRLWTAHWTRRPHICSSACGVPMNEPAGATQYDSNNKRGYDTSLSSVEWVHVVRFTFLHRRESK